MCADYQLSHFLMSGALGRIHLQRIKLNCAHCNELNYLFPNDRILTIQILVLMKHTNLMIAPIFIRSETLSLKRNSKKTASVIVGKNVACNYCIEKTSRVILH